MPNTLSIDVGQLDAEKFPNLIEFQKIWDGYRGDRPMPSWADFDFLDYPANFIQRMFIIDVDSDANDFRYRFIGTRVVEMEGIDYTGRSINELILSGGEDALRTQLESLVADPKPMFYIIKAMNEIKLFTMLYVGLRLPLSTDGETVDKILVMTHYDPAQSQGITDYLHDMFGVHGSGE